MRGDNILCVIIKMQKHIMIGNILWGSRWQILEGFRRKVDRKRWEREGKQMDLSKGYYQMQQIWGDENNTKEKGINVGMYLTLCGCEKLNQCVFKG